MDIVPIGERVLVKLSEQEEKTRGGLFIPESAKEQRKEGTVVSVGTLEDGKEMPIKPGDTIIYGGYSSEEWEIDGKKYVFVDFKDVLAKIK